MPTEGLQSSQTPHAAKSVKTHECGIPIDYEAENGYDMGSSVQMEETAMAVNALNTEFKLSLVRSFAEEQRNHKELKSIFKRWRVAEEEEFESVATIETEIYNAQKKLEAYLEKQKGTFLIFRTLLGEDLYDSFMDEEIKEEIDKAHAYVDHFIAPYKTEILPGQNKVRISSREVLRCLKALSKETFISLLKNDAVEGDADPNLLSLYEKITAYKMPEVSVELVKDESIGGYHTDNLRDFHHSTVWDEEKYMDRAFDLYCCDDPFAYGDVTEAELDELKQDYLEQGCPKLSVWCKSKLETDERFWDKLDAWTDREGIEWIDDDVKAFHNAKFQDQASSLGRVAFKDWIKSFSRDDIFDYSDPLKAMMGNMKSWRANLESFEQDPEVKQQPTYCAKDAVALTKILECLTEEEYSEFKQWMLANAETVESETE